MSYVYEGETVKINQKDWEKLCRLFPKLDLLRELDILDLELREQKKWYMPMMAKLRYRNDNSNQRPSHQVGAQEIASDVSWAPKVIDGGKEC